ncbi:MAG: DUF484 family protein [Pseudomonadota bacterium]
MAPSDQMPGQLPLGSAAGAQAGQTAMAEPHTALTLDAEERDLVRSLILAEPGLVLDDDGVMRALIQATGPLDRNVVDLRDRLVERLETRLTRLMRANRSMMAAAYENVASNEAVQAAVLEIMGARDLAGLAGALAQSLPDRVSIEAARLVIEADVSEIAPADALGPDGYALVLVPRGTLADYLGHAPRQEGAAPSAPDDREGSNPIVLRATNRASMLIYDQDALASEALLPLSLQGGAGLLALGSADPERFSPEQGTELLSFLAAVTERLADSLLADWQPPGDGLDGRPIDAPDSA